jgi:serine/threonine protein kinase
MLAEVECPSREVLARLVQGDLSDDEMLSLERHLEHCPMCTRALPSVDAADSFVRDAQNSPLRELENDERRLVDGLIARAKFSAASTHSDGGDGSLTPADDVGAFALGAESHERAPDDLCDFLVPDEQGGIGRLSAYRLLKVLGAGGMGMVFLAEDTQLGRLAAVKVLKPVLAASELARKRFATEARAAAALKHTNIVTIYHVGEERGLPFLAMERLAGETLADRLSREAKLPAAEVVRIGREIAAGLAAAHGANLIHRDIKPSNVWLEDPGARVKILDFGLARIADSEAGITQTGAVVGTAGYMAPEQAAGEAVDHRSDLFSLGCVLYQLCTGRVPFAGRNVTATLYSLAHTTPTAAADLEPSVPSRLSQLVMQLLAREPARRQPTAAAVADELAAIERDQASSLETSLNSSRAARERATGQRAGWMAAAAALLIAALIGIGYGADLLRWLRNEGQLTIAGDGPRAEITLTGPDRDIVLDADSSEVNLPAGEYQVALAQPAGDRSVSPQVIRVKAGGHVTIRIEVRIADQRQSTRDVPQDQDRISPSKGDADAKVATDGAASSAADPSIALRLPALRYGWKQGRQLVYDVHLEWDDGDGPRGMIGSFVFDIQSSDDDEATVRVSGSLAQQMRPPIDRSWPPRGIPRDLAFGFGPTFLGQGHEVTFDRRGKVLAIRGDSQMPFALGNLSTLIVDELPERLTAQWKQTRQLPVRTWPREGRFGGRLPLPFEAPLDRASDGIETATFAVSQQSENRVLLTKDFTLEASERIGGKPRCSIKGRSNLTFDRGEGVFSKSRSKNDVAWIDGAGENKLQVRLDLSLVDEAELERRKKLAAENMPRPLTAEEHAKLLEDLRTNDAARQAAAANLLKKRIPGDDRAEMAAALVPLLDHTDRQLRDAAAAALAKWATAEEVPVLLKLLEDPATGSRWAAIDALGELRDPRAIEALVRRLSVPIDRMKAIWALEKFSSGTEKPLLALVAHDEAEVRRAAAELLGKKGTAESLPAMERLAAHDDEASVRAAAGQAVAAIKNRK